MNKEQEINEKINQMMNKVRDKHPELIQFIDEIPITIPNKENPEVNLKALESYYNTIREILDRYAQTH